MADNGHAGIDRAPCLAGAATLPTPMRRACALFAAQGCGVGTERPAIHVRERQLPLLDAWVMFIAAMRVREDTRKA